MFVELLTTDIISLSSTTLKNTKIMI